MKWPVTDPVVISQGFSTAHPAYDFAESFNAPVFAPVDGTVIAIGTDPKYRGGLYVVIREDHPDQYEYYAGHHNKLLVSVGERVHEGQLVARIGATGLATGPHTHFQIRNRNGVLLHPKDVYDARNKGVAMNPEQLTKVYEKIHESNVTNEDKIKLLMGLVSELYTHMHNANQNIDALRAKGTPSDVQERIAAALEKIASK